MTEFALNMCDTQTSFRGNIIGRCCFQIHQPFMIFTLLITAAAFIIIFVAVKGYSHVSYNYPIIVHCIRRIHSSAANTDQFSRPGTANDPVCVCLYVQSVTLITFNFDIRHTDLS